MEHVLVREAGRAALDEGLRTGEHRRFDNRRERSVELIHCSGLLSDPRLLQLEGSPAPNVVADVLLVDEKLMDGTSRPIPPKVGDNTAFI